MEWYYEINAHNKLKPKKEIYRKGCLKRSIFEQDKKNTYFERLRSSINTLALLSILIVVVLLLIYCYNSNSNAMAYLSHENNDIYVPFKERARVSVRSTQVKPSEVTKEVISRISTVRPVKLSASETSKSVPSFHPTSNANWTTLPSSQITQEKPLEVPMKIITRTSTVRQMKSSKNVTSRSVPVFRSTSKVDCRMYSCFNYTRCPLTGGFLIYLYNPYIIYNGTEDVTDPIKEILGANKYITTNATEACIFLVITEFSQKNNSKSRKLFQLVNESILSKLPHWGRDGRNHVLLNLGQSRLATGTGSAIIAQSMFTHKQYRPGFDVVIPQDHTPAKKCPLISPARRKHLISLCFLSRLLRHPREDLEWSYCTLPETTRLYEVCHEAFEGPRRSLMGRNAEREALVKYLQEIEWSEIHNLRFHFRCTNVERLSEKGIDDWALCGNRKSRRIRLLVSTFSLIIAPGTYNYTSTNLFQTRLYEALESGAIPVILGGDRIRLPYEEVLDWRKAVLRIPMARATELRFLLQKMADEDIIAYRKHGRMFFERYIGSVRAIVDTLLAVIRTRLNIPPRPVESKKPELYDYLGYKNEEIKSFEILPLVGTKSKEITALNETKKQSTTYKRNFTVGLLNGYELWNSWGDPFALYPELPWDPILPPEARYLNPSVSAQYHNTCSPLAGDRPVENFTIVILTYSSERNTMLLEQISKLSKLPYLHKIVVICNGPKPSTKGWPTNVPIALVRAPHNSLNNRFLPYDLIETEAVFCVDDDIVPPPLKEIVFAFKVWREHRDLIVGFYGRSFKWNSEMQNGFLYTNRCCNVKGCLSAVSIILTGTAFIHRYYFWAYWRQLPASVRQFVDKHKNCEDIAMNFMVAHITKKPHIRVTSTWLKKMSMRARTSYRKLSLNSSHTADRHRCLNYFSTEMGYNPLLNTHYRVSYFPKPKRV